MTPSASSRWMRFQQGVDDRPTRLPISATDSEASPCSSDRILRSVTSIFGRRSLDGAFIGMAPMEKFFSNDQWNTVYREFIAISSRCRGQQRVHLGPPGGA